MGKGYLPLFLDTFDETIDLTDEEFGRLIRAIGAYAKGEEYASIITGNERYAFPFLKGQIDRNLEISSARAKAGSSRREPDEKANGNKPEQNETNANKREQKEAKSPKEKENNNNNKNKKENMMFTRFWEAYPRHEAKAVALRAFEKLNPGEALLQTMLTAIERWKKTAQWTDDEGTYIPYPATWLNQRRWEDEPPRAASSKAVPAQRYSQRSYRFDETDTMDDVLNRLKGQSA